MADTTAGALKRSSPSGAAFDPVFRILCFSAATLMLAAIAGVLVSLLIGGMPAFAKFGTRFFTSTVWNPVTEEYGGAGPIVGTLITSVIALLIALPLAFGVAVYLTEFCPRVVRRPIGTAVELLAGGPLDRLRHVGPVRARAAVRQIRGDPRHGPGPAGFDLGDPPVGRAERLGPADGVADPGGDDPALHRRHPARTVPDRAGEAARERLRRGLHLAGSGLAGHPAPRPQERHRRGHAGPRSRPGRNHGGDLRHRQQPQPSDGHLRQRLDHRLDHRQRVRRGDRRDAHRRPAGAGPSSFSSSPSPSSASPAPCSAPKDHA